MRAIALPILAVAALLPAHAGPWVSHGVDLDRPGVLAAIEHSNPQLYLRIRGVLDAAQAKPCETLPQILKAQFEASLGTCSSYSILTSFPPKRRITFVIDDTGYSSNVVQVHLDGKIQPLD
ncbi:MAG TPA: hypothetical protein VH301_16145 [Usitatibacter sp.]|jgi:hypothetical protein|nr:hypothetical protein [Usitatibacter sp.]